MTDTNIDALRQELAALDPVLQLRLRDRGFDPQRLLELARASAHGEGARAARNRIPGPVSPPATHEFLGLPPPGEDRERMAGLGLAAIARGELAFCVMAGGMATRMGSVVKALVEIVPGKTFLDIRLRENALWSQRSGRVVPLWLMTSEATDGAIRDALKAANAPPHVRTFLQDLGLRLTPDLHLFRDAAGHPSTYATGHGDLVDGLRRAGFLRSFREQGGKYVWITNLDNLGATIDPAILGTFLEAGSDVMVEVCDKVAGDRGGVPVHAQGRLQILEEFRLPDGFDPRQVRVFNTNTFLAKADPLETAAIRWNWFEVEKNVDGRTAVQFERLLQELTAAMRASYVKVPREGERARFLPVKDPDELARRQRDIEAVLRARGLL